MCMYESRSTAPISLWRFCLRLLAHAAAGLALMGLSLAAGVLGFICFEQLPWADALMNAALMLGGGAPLALPQTLSGKLFVSGFAVYTGFVLVSVLGLMLTPVLHRILHGLHWNDAEADAD